MVAQRLQGLEHPHERAPPELSPQDGGHTWTPGREGPAEKTAIDLGKREILCIERNRAAAS